MKFHATQQGFTLVEMIVSIAIFIVVAIIAVGALLKVIDANKKAQSLQTTINNMDFALEAISRELRTGNTYVCGHGSGAQTIAFQPYTSPLTTNTTSCANMTPTGDGWVIAFYSSKTYPAVNPTCNLIDEFRYNPTTGSIEKAEQATCIDTSTPSFSPIISPEIILTNSTIKVTGGSNIQSYASFHFVGYSGAKEKNKSYFDIQTSASQRVGT